MKTFFRGRRITACPALPQSTLRKLAVATGLALCSGLLSAHASLLVSEDFNYGAGELHGKSGGTGFSGAWSANTSVTEILAGGLSYTRIDGYTHNGGADRLRLQGNSDTAAQRALASVFSGDTFYVGLLLNVTGTLDNNDFGAGWFNNMNGIGLGLKANQGGGATTYDVFARAKLDGNNAAYYQNLTMGVTYLVVAQFSKTTSGAANPYTTANLWVNPVYASSGTPNGTIIQSGTGLSSDLSSFGFRTANLDGGDTVYYDMLRIGTAWADVVPVPEPATFIAGALLLLPFGASTIRFLRRQRVV
ncbi:MAG: hypothetical protein IH623_12515 [Verrucomicrobia bacterium]|nr:hypothetical protein [Verrucomicrobiota bacterium]